MIIILYPDRGYRCPVLWLGSDLAPHGSRHRCDVSRPWKLENCYEMFCWLKTLKYIIYLKGPRHWSYVLHPWKLDDCSEIFLTLVEIFWCIWLCILLSTSPAASVMFLVLENSRTAKKYFVDKRHWNILYIWKRPLPPTSCSLSSKTQGCCEFFC